MTLFQWRYLRPLLTHPMNVIFVAGCCSLALLLALVWPSSWLLLSLGVIVEIALIFLVSDLPVWKQRIDREQQQSQQDQQRTYLLEQIKKIPKSTPIRNAMTAYNRMIDRIQSLEEMAQNGSNANHIDQFKATSLYFLTLIQTYSSLSTTNQSDVVAQARKTLRDIEEQLAQSDLSSAQRLQLQKAKEDQSSIIQRSSSREARLTALESSLLSIPDQMEEAYHIIMASPYASDVSERISESLRSLQQQENIHAQLESELSTLSSGDYSSDAIDARLAQATRQSSTAKPIERSL